MIFFSVKRKITIQFQSQKMTFQPPPARGTASPDHPGRIYCCTTADLIGIGRIFEAMSCKDNLQIIPEAKIKSRSDFPVQLGVKNDGEWERNQYYSGLTKIIGEDTLNIKNVNLNEQISGFKNKKNLRIAILNGFGSGIGDTLIGVTAFSRAYELIKESTSPKIEIIYSPEQYTKLTPIFQYVKFVDKFHIAPITLKKLLEFDAIFDTGGLAHRPEFKNKPVVDFLLTIFGLNPDEVQNADKRNKLIQFQPGDDLEKCFRKIRNDAPGKKIILLHPKTSSIFKNIPDKYVVEIIHKLHATGKYTIVSDERLPGTTDLPIIDLSMLAKSFRGLCGVVSQVDGILTADTCVYHIADCFSIPTIAWFTMYDPDIWARYYPTVRGILLGKDEDSGFLNKKPEHNDTNLGKLIKLWEETDIDQALSLLGNLVHQ
ncbi:MAG TPA: hypothetical protein ENJ08_03165 [Gammaproteobacteria bacterium]|nr:hypothetical protein [Gammaproteobacteria bacterium]